MNGTVPRSWSRLESLKLLRLNGNSLTGDLLVVASGMKKLHVLTASCQGDKIRGVVPCKQPFDLSSDVVLRLVGRLPHLSVIDVQNDTATLDTVAFWEDRASEQPSIEVHAVLGWVISVCVFLFLVVSVEAAHRRCATRISAFRIVRACDAFSASSLERSVVLGSLVWIAVAAICALVYVQVWSFRYASQSLVESTRPFEESRLNKDLNFIFNMSVPLRNVTDTWRTQQLTFLAQPPHFSSTGSMYEFPVGWDAVYGQLRREITFSMDVANRGGFSWSLGIDGKDSIHGSFSGARNPGAITVYYNETTGAETVGNVTSNVYGEVSQILTDLSGYLVPNRGRAQCLHSVNIRLLATPMNVSVAADPPSGTTGKMFQSYIFSQPTPLASHMTNESVCGPTSVTLILEQNKVLLNQSVVRTKTGVELASGLLGLLGGIASALRMAARVYTAVYKWWRRRKGKEELPLVLVPFADTDGSEDWTAQREWNRSVSERMGKAEAMHEKSNAMHEKWNAMHEKSNAMNEKWNAMHEKSNAMHEQTRLEVKELRGMVEALVKKLNNDE